MRDGIQGRDAALDAELILAEVLGVSRAELWLRRDRPVEDRHAQQALAWAIRRAAGVPMAYLLGRQEFYGRSFEVDPSVLIPRPETEHLVEEALRRDTPGWVVEVGTGSGAVAITLALELGRGSVLALDLSPQALEVARRNASRLGAPLRFVRSDLLSGMRPRPSLAGIVANLPYVDPRDRWRLPAGVRDHEPEMALVPVTGDAASLRRRLIRQARQCLRPGGYLALEVGAGQAGRAREDLLSAGFRRISIRNDLAGIGRVVSGIWYRRPSSEPE